MAINFYFPLYFEYKGFDLFNLSAFAIFSGGLTMFYFIFKKYIGKKMENLATIQDVRRISSEQQTGKMKIEAEKAVMFAVSNTISKFQRLSLEIAISGIENRESFEPKEFLSKMFLITSSLMEKLDEHSFLLNINGKKELNHFRTLLPQIYGASTPNIKWITKTYNSILIRESLLVQLKERLTHTFNENNVFNIEEANLDYDFTTQNNKMDSNANRMNILVANELAAYGFSTTKIKEIIDITITFNGENIR